MSMDGWGLVPVRSIDSYRRTRLRLPRHALVIGKALALTACSGDSGGDRETVIAPTDVNAAAGGTVAAPGNAVTVTVPPGGLSDDAKVSIVQVRGDLLALADSLLAAGEAYAIRVDGNATRNQAMRVEIAASAAPTHPQPAEMAQLIDVKWERASASFFRSSDKTCAGTPSGPWSRKNGPRLRRSRQIRIGDVMSKTEKGDPDEHVK